MLQWRGWKSMYRTGRNPAFTVQVDTSTQPNQATCFTQFRMRAMGCECSPVRSSAPAAAYIGGTSVVSDPVVQDVLTLLISQPNLRGVAVTRLGCSLAVRARRC